MRERDATYIMCISNYTRNNNTNNDMYRGVNSRVFITRESQSKG